MLSCGAWAKQEGICPFDHERASLTDCCAALSLSRGGRNPTPATQARPGEPPRRVQIERKKRAFATQDVGMLLSALGVTDFQELLAPSASPLPLELFDDAEFDVRTPAEWVAPLSAGAKAVRARAFQDGEWCGCQVLGVRDGFKAAARGAGAGPWVGSVAVGAKASEQGAAAPGGADEAGDSEEGEANAEALAAAAAATAAVLEASAASYLVELNDSGERMWIPRVMLCFMSEDPARYARRVAAALARRAKAEEALQYALLVDSMPTEDIPPLTVEQINRMLGFALNSKKLKDKLMDTSQLINEINIEYARTMNRIVFDAAAGKLEREAAGEASAKDAKLARMVVHLGATDAAEAAQAGLESAGAGQRSAEAARAPPQYDFSDQFSEFSFHSFLTKAEVNVARVKVRVECNRAASLSLFSTYFTKSARLDEFEQLQTQASEQVATHLKETWTLALKNSIRSSFKDVGKGWFNLHESSQETYECSKLKRFLVMVRFMMEDSLRYLAESSLESFTAFIWRHCAAVVKVEDTSTVHVLEEAEPAAGGVGGATDSVPPQTRRIPLLALTLTFAPDESRFMYTTDLQSLGPTVLGVFEGALTAVSAIPQLEPLIMEGLFWSHHPVLNSVHPRESHVLSMRERVFVAMRRATSAAAAYLASYQQFLELLALDPAAYVAELEAGEPTLEVLTAQIKEHTADAERIRAAIPAVITVGPFGINCQGVREHLVEKKTSIVGLLRDLVAAYPQRMAKAITDKYEAIEKMLKTPATNVEEVSDRREYMATVPRAVDELTEELDQALVWYDALEGLGYSLSDKAFNQQVTAQGWAKRVGGTAEKVTESLATVEQQYKEEMQGEQENFTGDVKRLETVVVGLAQHTDLANVESVSAEMHRMRTQIDKAVEDAALYNSREVLLGEEQTDYSSLKRTGDAFAPFYDLWTTAADWKARERAYMEDPFDTLVPEDMEAKVNGAWKTMYKTGKVFGLKGNEQCVANCATIRTEVEAFKEYLPLVQSLRNPGMRDRHWEQLTKEVGVNLKPEETGLTLAKAVGELKLLDHRDVITKVCDVAGKEFSIESSLTKMMGEWASAELQAVAYRETGTHVVRVDEQIVQQLDDHIVMTQSMSFSPYKKPFEEQIAAWDKQLGLVSEIIEEWMALQRSWMYLEPIFSSEDIQQQLPLEGKRFSNVDRMWRKTMAGVVTTPGVLEACSSQKMLDNFVEGNKMLESVQKGLSAYLESKRAVFSRFFFLSNDELLQILSQTKNPLAVQPHLKKCFEAIASIKFQPDLEITHMISAEKEEVKFDQSMYPKGNVENWLGEVENCMRAAIHKSIKDSLADYKQKPLKQWVKLWPGMTVLAVVSAYWTRDVEAALESGTMEAYMEQINGDVVGLTDLVRGKLSSLERKTLSANIVISVHNRDVTTNLLKEKVSSVSAFEWVSQLRYYWEDDNMRVKMVSSDRAYGYEYLGNSMRLVITPLTDRCYMTLMGAMHLNLGGAPAGPAGTGKTETVKARN